MRNGILYVALFAFLFSCNSNDDATSSETELIGTWKLVENYADPGDGSGDFETVDSNKTIQFHSDGSITSNGSLCDMSIQSTTPTSGTYSSTDFTINSEDCTNSSGFNITYTMNNSFLTISYPCIESCLSKYVKVQ
ncbi:hypothetical protein [Ulvibacter litoralis]|uniref:Lipocalin-like domain-containing protein n=1 Tax=Ulvibacter litoralis TaxID=227084 RepID=A0A1G7HCZ9_9FLAO|nr:hypothetical protein [Ulvibacter litoralis]GHC57302.1 hypothetical protein GCM10008083_22290 [Ulvibacter litoralis]SDE98184.1 hypothetical protein SAMN05421855_10414 [Ulvibacter litoralis]